VKKTFTYFIFTLASSLFAFSQTRTTITITDKEVFATSYTDNEIILNNQTDLHITATTAPLTNSIINLNSENAWVFFDNIKPADVNSAYLQYFKVNGQAAVLKSNVRMSIYKHGTVIIPHPSGFQPFQAFTGQNFTTDSVKYSLFTLNKALGTFDNKIRSFKLKRGYMATLANNPAGTGYSRVFIADKEDLNIAELPMELDQLISFIRVMDWEWVTKKGWCGYDPNHLNLITPTWRYDWSASGNTTSAVEYVPIKQNMGWPGYDEITNKTYVTHLLGFNEPDHTEQSNVTVDAAVADWPNMLKTGLRVGSPACTDFGWLYDFMAKCNAKNYRVDYVAVHAYWGGKSPQSWYNDLKYIHERTGRPIWITEWNNGANWTSEGGWPNNTRPLLLTAGNAAKQLADIKAILQVLDTASFIERYSIYNWVEDARALVLNGVITPAGQYYADDKSVMAFNRSKEVIPTYSTIAPTLTMMFTGNTSMSLISTDYNNEFNKGYVLEKRINNGDFVEIQRNPDLTNVRYSETFDVNTTDKFTFRMRTILPNGSETANSNEVGFDITNGGAIQYGNMNFANVGWNTVLFKQVYTTIPVIIFGSPTNNNFTIRLSNRVKQINGARFSFQLAPWAYQTLPVLKEETIPYFILEAGDYDFGGLKAIASKATIAPTWTNVTFSTPFDTIPVVFVTQLTSSAVNATGVRVRNVTKTGFQAKIQKESKITTTLPSESVSFLAITPGKGIIDNREVIVGRTANNAVITTPPYTVINYGDTITNPVFLAQMQTCNDDTVTATLRCQTISSNYARVFKQRELSLNITATATEGAGWMLINPESTIQGLIPIKNNEIEIFPNPVSDYIFFGIAVERTKVNIYNMYGILVKSETITGNKLDVKSLIPGYYLIKTSKNQVAKFIKI